MFKDELRERLNGTITDKDTLGIIIDEAERIYVKKLDEERKTWFKEIYNNALVVVSKIYSEAERQYREIKSEVNNG